MTHRNSHSIFSGSSIANVKDVLLMAIVGVLIVSYVFVKSLIIGDTEQQSTDVFVNNLLFSVSISILLYAVFRVMFRYLNNQYPWLKSIGKRLRIQLVLVVILSAGIMGIFNWMWFVLFFDGCFDKSSFFSNIIIAVVISLLINAVYEGVNLFRQLKDSQIETEKLKRQNIESHFETLKNQVGPHFLFNSLNTLLALIDDDTKLAKEFVQKLATYYRYALQVNEKDVVELETETALVKSYVFLLESRFGKNLNVHFDLPESSHTKGIVPLAMQMLVENAVKHNVISSAHPLEIRITIENNYLVVVNSKLKKDALEQSNRIGLENIRNRYQLLTGMAIRVESEQDDYFRVEIPLIDLDKHSQ
jgi:two-component system LytT family sensor kinase